MRITKVTTKTGDDGKTSLADGQRITKNHPIINTLGDLDHLNSIIGWAEVASSNKIFSQELKKVNVVLNNSFAFGGMNAVLALKKFDD